MTRTRVAVCNWSRRKAGGTETYLGNVIEFLHREGYEVAFLHETDAPAARAPIALPEGTPTWCVEELGPAAALDALRAWGPDVLYTHILESVRLEAALLDVAPAVFDAHAYYGTCVGGTKAFKRPVVTPCSRRLGWQCLLHYYPHRCGGLSPVTMVRRYRIETARHALLPRYRAVVTHSEHMRAEYIRHGVAPERAFNVSAALFGREDILPRTDAAAAQGPAERDAAAGAPSPAPDPARALRLLFVGRMDPLKGGQVLLDALPAASMALGRPLYLTLAGDGPARRAWERRAARLGARHASVRVEFAGWLDVARLNGLYASSDLLVVPSLWPEPFGRIGLEAGRHGVPSAAFAVGGIPDWLVSGVNGHMAPGNPPTAAGLSAAIVACLGDPAHHAHLRRGALERSTAGGPGGSWPLLLEIFSDVARARAPDQPPGRRPATAVNDSATVGVVP